MAVGPDSVLEDALAICAIPAPTFAEGPRARLVARLLAQIGAGVTVDAVGNVVCRLGGSGPATVFAAHLDTVFGPDQPAQIVRDGGRIAAPGIGDNSLAVSVLLHLARRYITRPPIRPLVLAATVGEEGLGDLRGAKHLVSSIQCACFVAVEGMSLQSIEIGGVGSERYRVTYSGAGGHPWSDRGTPSAVHGLIQRAGELLATGVETGGVLNVGRIEGGTSINTIAAQATLELDLRARDPAQLTALAQRASAALADAPAGLRAEIKLVGRRPAGALPPEHPLLAAARRARESAGLGPATEGYSSTDANAAYGQGIPAITVGVTTGAHAHRLDEYINEAPIAQGVRAIELLADDLTGAGTV